MTIAERKQARAKLVEDGRALLKKAEDEKRDLTTEEEARYNTIIGDATKAGVNITREEKQLELERGLESRSGSKAGQVTDPPAGAARGNDDPKAEEARIKLVDHSFRRWMINGWTSLKEAEQRALQVDVDTSGGYLVAPQQFVAGIIKAVDDLLFIRALATKFSVPNADSLGQVALDADPADADWTSEIATGAEDTAMKFGKRELKPNPLGKLLKVSNTLLRKVPDAGGLVQRRLAYKFAVPEEKAFLTGTGAAQPLGVFTASAQGISTARDISEDNTTTAVTFDGLKSAQFGLKGAYWNSAQWLFHRDALKQISKLKDGEGQYQWKASTQEGEPDRLLGRPFNMSEFAPNTFTTGLYVGILGDFSQYYIADSLSMQIQRLVELYAVTNQTGFIGRLETDGMPVLEEAFVRVTLA